MIADPVMGATEASARSKDYLVLTVGDQKAGVCLLRNEAPQSCDLITRTLPLEGRLTHAKHVDNEIIFMLPFIADFAENYRVPKAGYLFIWRFTLCTWFGPTCIEALPNCFGRVTSNLEGLAAVGRTIWAHQGVPVRLDWKEAKS